ncbi:MAG: winged helix-turn-helix domain-containing protein [Patescibacteria group bacterium UBA2163]
MILLDELDNKILSLISKQELHPSEMARQLGILRTTVQYRLKKIEEFGLAQKRISGRKTLWSVAVRTEHNKSHFKVYRGADFVQSYKQLLSLPAHATIFAIQGSKAAKGELNTLPAEFIKESHKILKRKKIILKGVTNEKTLRVFTGTNKSLMQSHIGRTLGIKLFQDNHFLGAGEILSTKKLLLLSNPVAKQAIVIKDKGIAEIIHDTLDLIFEVLDGKNTFDLNSYLRNKITSK